MPWHLPETVLVMLRARYVSGDKSLTEQENAIARRIIHCQRCGRTWLTKRRGKPERCSYCFAKRYDTPTLDALLASEARARTEPPPPTASTSDKVYTETPPPQTNAKEPTQ